MAKRTKTEHSELDTGTNALVASRDCSIQVELLKMDTVKPMWTYGVAAANDRERKFLDRNIMENQKILGVQFEKKIYF